MQSLETFQEILGTFAALRSQRIEVYSELLKRAESVLAKQRAEDELRPRNFNVFSALGHAHREVATHSAMLAHLLDPGATHRQGTRFLTGFLNVLQQAAEMQGKLLQLPLPEARTRYKWRCRREVPLPDGQADIVLRGPGLLLIIENKIYASDREDQLWRYWQYAKNEKNVLPVIVYLTPDGRRPTTNSVRGDRELSQKLVLLSYHRDISRFIEETLTDLQAVSVAEVLR